MSQSSTDPLWFKDAVIYEMHVRAYFDSNGDGIGDFPGLIQKLDYIQELGVNCIWLLPFYPSPLRDDGYDISNYRDVHKSYGTMRDFKVFLREAHNRGLRVFTELVVNHTSDQHPWFQAARRAAPGSAKRKYYVWSDTAREYEQARIIFTDTEVSNWAFDSVAKSHYWHRFFSHQPDLNYDNPHVRRAVMKVMQYWLEMGVDGLRLDAVPYLIEREGTNCENLAETHEILKALRHEVNQKYPDRALLAEANQWPADVRPYFGDGDECHLAYHFPLMPRIFMAVRQEDAHPIVEILRQTPELPGNCQWALFLRNHDELTLEMVTDEERDYLYGSYAADPQMRLNRGIRRRLAPLMEYSRNRIELLNSLLFSLPGSPIIYYGDEIGMGDNVYLGDRNGVRTPMQWTGDRNAGFSRADPARLFAPPVMDPLYGYQAINVEAQERSPSSLLNWMRRMIALRKRYKTFGRGTIDFVANDNRRILSYLREDEEHQILVVANMARSVQPVHLDLQRFRGRRPVEMIGNTELPTIGTDPYFLTMGPHGFYWFLLQKAAEPITLQRPMFGMPGAELPTLLVSAVWQALFDGHARRVLERDALKPFLKRQRWFGSKARPIAAARFVDWQTIRPGPHPLFMTIVEVEFADGGPRERYILPVSAAGGAEAQTISERVPGAIIAKLSGAKAGVLFDALTDPSTGQVLFDLMRHGGEISLRHGSVRPQFIESAMGALAAEGDGLKPHIPSLEQSNTNVLLGDRYLLKVFRRLQDGENPDIEIGRALAAAGSKARVPALIAWADYQSVSGQDRASLLMLQQQVPTRGAAWERAVDQVHQYLERAQVVMRGGQVMPAERNGRNSMVEEIAGAYWTSLFLIGRRTGELHATLADLRGDGFGHVPLERAQLEQVSGEMQAQAARALDLLERQQTALEGDRLLKARRLLELRTHAMQPFKEVATLERAGQRIRIHGDFHLGQVLEVDGDVVIIDFEGEPTRTIAERRELKSPLRDVAGMLRSFAYAAHAGLRQFLRTQPDATASLVPWALAWEETMGEIYQRAYLAVLDGVGLLPPDPKTRQTLLNAFILDKAFYELTYELGSRPDWVDIPLDGLLRVLDPSWTLPPPPPAADGHA
jgi:maltose alpha-D-glucosyltransferase / alpha-amylase